MVDYYDMLFNCKRWYNYVQMDLQDIISGQKTNERFKSSDSLEGKSNIDTIL